MTTYHSERDYKKLFESGNKAQLEKLILYSGKPDFKNYSIRELYGLLEKEVFELLEEVVKDPMLLTCLRNEAADVANYAHMIILECDRLMKKRK